MIVDFIKVLQRRILLQVERAAGEKNLLDCNGCGYKVDPLTSVLALEKHLHTMVSCVIHIS